MRFVPCHYLLFYDFLWPFLHVPYKQALKLPLLFSGDFEHTTNALLIHRGISASQTRGHECGCGKRGEVFAGLTLSYLLPVVGPCQRQTLSNNVDDGSFGAPAAEHGHAG